MRPNRSTGVIPHRLPQAQGSGSEQSGQPQVHGHGIGASSTPGGCRWIQRSFTTGGLLGQEASVFAEQGPALKGLTAGFGPADMAGTEPTNAGSVLRITDLRADALGGGSVLLSLFAIALAGTGLLTTVGVIVSMDTFGPVSDNAQGIAEMSGDVHGEGAAVLTRLDAVGNSTKAITKGIAIATAVLAATALFGAFRDAIIGATTSSGANDILNTVKDPWQYAGILDVASPANLVGLIIGAAVVFLFSGLAINAVSRAAGAVIFEVRRQFREHPGIMLGTEKPEYGKVVDIVTRDSLRELVTPGILAVFAPIAVGFGLGVGALGAYLAGTIATGVLMAVFLSNSGGAWDNAKKFVEDGHFGGKGSEAHSATVIGDTVGDPFKDTAGPAINPLIKVMNLVALLIAPAVVAMSIGADENAPLRWIIALVAVVIIVTSVVISKRRPIAVGDQEFADTK